jgi:hypothetical protein
MNNPVERVTAVFEAAVLLEPAERLSFVREACADDRPFGVRWSRCWPTSTNP